MAQITGGIIKFGRKTAPAQYENKEAVVELYFSLAEGEPLGDLLHEVAAKVQAKALEMVGLKSVAVVDGKGRVTESAKAAIKDVTEKVVADEKQQMTKTKEAYAAKKAEEAALKPVDSLTSLTDETDGHGGEHDPDTELFEKVTAITDLELVAAVTRKNQEIRNPKAIHAVRETFVKLPKGLRDIEQKDRPAFLEALKALK